MPFDPPAGAGIAARCGPQTYSNPVLLNRGRRMLNYIWGGLIVASLLFAIVHNVVDPTLDRNKQ